MKVALLSELEIETLVSNAVAKTLQLQSQNGKATAPKQADTNVVTMQGFCSEFSFSRTRANQLIKSGILKPKRFPGSRRIFFTRDSILKALGAGK
ncbi:MAG: hypothetical protein EHM20_00700 [Alphaproteobacteria bacterium]|nr:MAG: hypothetical protein EHM20_00700 [Alphaproteobacteria bacterium]